MGSMQRRIRRHLKQTHVMTNEFVLPCIDCTGRAIAELKKQGVKFAVKGESILTSGIDAQQALRVFRGHCEYLDMESKQGSWTRFAAFSFF